MTDKHWADWEGYVFGYGYGTGEPHTIPALRQFPELCKGPYSSYRSAEVEARALGTKLYAR